MPGRAETLFQRLIAKAQRGNRGDPVGTIAFYGPDDQHATKLVVGISPDLRSGITETRQWWSELLDVRNDARLLEEVSTFLTDKGIKSLIMTNGIYGCPHEEGIDYLEGSSCEQCVFWKAHSRVVTLIGL
jgi:hypothetical protein